MGKFAKEKKVSLKGLATGNGKPGKLSLAGLKKKPLPQKQTKQDFYDEGLLYWNATIINGVSEVPLDGVIVRPIGTVDVSNGDQTYTFHNRYGSWMADMGGGKMAELAWVARALGTNLDQEPMFRRVKARFDAELKAKKILDTDTQRNLIEERAKTTRAVTRSRTTRQKNQTPNPWMGKFG